jgi:hypothetical protein
MRKPIAGLFGSIDAPPGVENYGGGTLAGFRGFVNNIVQLVIIFASIYAFINILLAGYAFISAGDDPKKIQSAWAKIWQTLLGLAIAAGAFVLAALIGKMLFDDYGALLKLRYVTP